MEEAALDHGKDRLPFHRLFSRSFSRLFSWLWKIFPALLLAFFSLGTTFGPIPLAEQIRHAKYLVHGRITTNSWVEKDRASQRPYTLWKMQVLDSASTDKLEGEIVFRVPGGEIDGIGYHVAGSAGFRNGETVLVILRDGDEPNIKELVGLASGKYTVEHSPNGDVVRSFVGAPVLDGKGAAMNPKTMLAFANRVFAGKESEADRSVYINKEVTHDEDPVLEARIREAKTAEKNLHPGNPGKEITPTTGSPQQSQIPTEEPKNGSAVGKLILIGLCFSAMIFVIARMFF